MPLAVRDRPFLGLAAHQRQQAAALRALGQPGTARLAEGGCEVDRGYRLVDHLAGLDARPARDHADAQQVFVRDRMLQVEAMVAEHVAVVGAVDHERVLREALGLERLHQPADVVVDQRDHRVVVRGHLGELLVGLVRAA